MGTALIAGSFALAGVLVGNLMQYLVARRTHRLATEEQRRRDREQAYAEVLTRLEEARQAVLLASAPDTARWAPPVVDRSRAAATARVALEQATFRAWLLAGPQIRVALDELIETINRVTGEWIEARNDEDAQREGWPRDTSLRQLMRQELAPST